MTEEEKEKKEDDAIRSEVRSIMEKNKKKIEIKNEKFVKKKLNVLV